MKGVKHYKKDGTVHTGSTHKMPDGSLHTGKTHSKTSVKLFHYKDLSKTAKAKADGTSKKSKKVLKSGLSRTGELKAVSPLHRGLKLLVNDTFLLKLLSLLLVLSILLQPVPNEKARLRANSLWLNLKKLQTK
jgi:hypothetical protein